MCALPILAEATAALYRRCFAYLSMPRQRGADAQVISTYPAAWTGHYVESHYERVDPVILRAARTPDPFEWGHGVDLNELNLPQQRVFDEAAGFGIRCGFTIPIHDGERKRVAEGKGVSVSVAPGGRRRLK